MESKALLSCAREPPRVPLPEAADEMAMSGALRMTTRRMMQIELPEFSKSRFSRRYNMMEEDRIKWYNWNLACIGLTTIPLAWMYTVNYRTCEEVETINRCLNPMGIEKVKYDLRLYGS